MHLNAGKVALVAGKKWLAKQHLIEAGRLASAASDDQAFFESQLYLCELAQIDGDDDESRRLVRILTMDAPRFRLDRRTAEDYEKITGHHS